MSVPSSDWTERPASVSERANWLHERWVLANWSQMWKNLLISHKPDRNLVRNTLTVVSVEEEEASCQQAEVKFV